MAETESSQSTSDSGSKDKSTKRGVSFQEDKRPDSTPNPFSDSPYRPDTQAIRQAEQSLAAKETPKNYLENGGNFRHISPHDVKINKHQFYPDIPLNASKPSDKQESHGKAAAEEKPFKDVGKIPETEDGQKQSQGSLDTDDPSVREATQLTVDSDLASTVLTVQTGSAEELSQPKGPSKKAKDEDGEVFTTQVDEATLAAARQRRKEQSGVFSPEGWSSSDPHEGQSSMALLIQDKADEHFNRAMKHFNGGQYVKTINALDKAINLTPEVIEYYVYRAECFLHLTDFQSAILNYKKACVLDPDNDDYYQRLAFIYYFQGECLFDETLYPEALESFSRAAEMRPDVTGYHTRSIACLAALNRHGECLALVNKRLEDELENADLYVMRARLHDLFKNATLCYYDVKDALTLDPDHREAQNLMKKLEEKSRDHRQQAINLNLVGRYRDALQKISISIETNPSVAEYHVFRGALHRRLADFNAAIDDYLLALDKTDHNEESPVYIDATRQLLLTYNDFAVECFTKGFYEEATILLNKAIKGEKNEKGLYVNRGDCFYRQGNLAFALQDYHQALEMDPNDGNVRARIAVIHNEFGIQDYQDKNYQEAESRFTLAIKHNPRVGQYYISRSRARQVMENENGARQDLLMALHLDPGNDEITSVMARLFPGKSIKDVLNSRASETAKIALDNLVVTAGPVKLDPIASADGSKASASAHSMPARSEMMKACMDQEQFTTQVVEEKKRINRKIKGIFHDRKSLAYTGGRVKPAPPAPIVAKGSHSGWKKFTAGINA